MPNPVQGVLHRSAQSAGAGDQHPAREARSTGRSRLHRSATQQQQLLRVAPVERQLHDPRRFHDLTDADAARLNQRRVGLDFHLFRNLADLERDVDRRVAADLQDNSHLHKRPESGQTCLQAVRT